MKIDTVNRHLVGVKGEHVVILNQPIGPLSREHALMLAAWLVTMAPGEPITDDEFQTACSAIESA